MSEIFSGFTKFWVYARRNDAFYLTNKIISVILATSMAIHTSSLKYKVVKFVEQNPEDTTALTYNIMYWALFVFYAFHAVDELIELYSVYFKREKGALGLLLELNYVLGVALLTWILLWAGKPEAAMLPADMMDVYNWIKF